MDNFFFEWQTLTDSEGWCWVRRNCEEGFAWEKTCWVHWTNVLKKLGTTFVEWQKIVMWMSPGVCLFVSQCFSHVWRFCLKHLSVESVSLPGGMVLLPGPWWFRPGRPEGGWQPGCRGGGAALWEGHPLRPGVDGGALEGHQALWDATQEADGGCLQGNKG